MNQQIKTILPLAAFAAVAMTGAAQAAATAGIITPTGVTGDSNLSGSYHVNFTIDGSGLSGGGNSGDILNETHINGDAGGSLTWLSASGNRPTITIDFDLGGTFDVDSVHLWNWTYNSATDTRGVTSMDISFSSNGGTTFSNTLQDVAFTPYPLPANTTSATSETQTFAAVNGVTHIRLTDINNALDPGDAYVGFSEIRFGEAVPEPSTSALLGLGGLALILRRRK